MLICAINMKEICSYMLKIGEKMQIYRLYQSNMQSICTKYAKNMLKYVYHMQLYASNMHLYAKKYALNLQIYRLYQLNMQETCHKYADNMI